jgi:hypothetical protein
MRSLFDARQKEVSKSKDKEINEINELRSKSGLVPIVRTNRRCMNCSRAFISEGAWNRLCWTCSTSIMKEGF